jgi:hypothetical protein
MKFYVLFSESRRGGFESAILPDDVCVLDAPDVLKAAEDAHFRMGLTEDTTGEFVCIPVEACATVALETKEVPDFRLIEQPKERKPKGTKHPKAKASD